MHALKAYPSWITSTGGQAASGTQRPQDLARCIVSFPGLDA